MIYGLIPCVVCIARRQKSSRSKRSTKGDGENSPGRKPRSARHERKVTKKSKLYRKQHSGVDMSKKGATQVTRATYRSKNSFVIYVFVFLYSCSHACQS